MRYLLDTGIAQEFIGRNAKVVQRADAARRVGNRLPRQKPSTTTSSAFALGRLALHQRGSRAVWSGVRRTSPHRETHAADRHHGRRHRVRPRQLHSRIQRHGSCCNSRSKGRELGRTLKYYSDEATRAVAAFSLRFRAALAIAEMAAGRARRRAGVTTAWTSSRPARRCRRASGS
jgi:hypothetical protein